MKMSKEWKQFTVSMTVVLFVALIVWNVILQIDRTTLEGRVNKIANLQTEIANLQTEQAKQQLQTNKNLYRLGRIVKDKLNNLK